MKIFVFTQAGHKTTCPVLRIRKRSHSHVMIVRYDGAVKNPSELNLFVTDAIL